MAKKIRKIDNPSLLQLKMTLDGVTPPIWRRVQVDNSLMFYHLHLIIQRLMNWDNCHLHDFDLGDNIKIVSNSELDSLAEVNIFGSKVAYKFLDEEITPLGAFLKKEQQKILYTYDFGDNWEIEIVVETITPKQPEDKKVCCLAGKRNGPPEDSGGIPGYMNALECLKNKKHPDRKDLIEWYGQNFDPEEFDLDEINKKFDRYNKTKH